MTVQNSEKMIHSIVRNEAGLYDVVYFYGNGKSIGTLLDELTAELEKTEPDIRVFRTEAASLHEKWVWNLQRGYKNRLPECDLFVLENIQNVAGREYMEEELYGIFDRFLEGHRRLIITGNAPTAQMLPLAERIRAQIDGGVAFCLE